MRFSVIIAVLLTLGIFLHWAFGYACVLSFHEQNQMFLYSASYFASRAVLPGGLCAYASEYLTQFYFYPQLGALLLALVYAGLYLAMHRLLVLVGARLAVSAVLALALPILMLCVMGDEQVMLCYALSLLLVLAVSALLCGLRKRWLAVAVLPVLYYVAGPVSFVLALLAVMLPVRGRRPIHYIIYIVAFSLEVALCLWLTYALITPRYPWPVLLQGIFYHRAVVFDHVVPTGLLLLPLLAPALVAVASLISRLRRPALLLRGAALRWSLTLSVMLLCLAAAWWVRTACYDADKYAQLRQDYLIRGSHWQQLLDEAKLHQPHTPMSCTAVNLALAMTHQLPQRQFEYYQCGINGLFVPQTRDNIQPLPTMEAYYQLGLINLSQWFAFEAQQAIPNQNQSARLTQRLAECCIISGRYEVAAKYIDLLSQTRFYSHWASQARRLLWHDELVALHPEYGRLRRYMLTDDADCLVPHREVEKIVGRLCVRDDSNRLAVSYFLSALLLQGLAEQFVAYLSPEQQRLPNPFPRGYQTFYERMVREYAAEPPTPDAVTGATVL